MTYLNDDDLLLDNEIKFSIGVQNIGDEMARLVFSKKANIDDNNLVFTYDDFYKKNPGKLGGLKKKSFNNLPKRDNNSNKSVLKSSLKMKTNKKTSFNSTHDFPIKKVSSGNKSKLSKLSKNNSQDLGVKINESKDEGNKKYVKFNQNRMSVVVNPNYYINQKDTNPKNPFFKFINKKNEEKTIEEKKSSKKFNNLIPENTKINDDNNINNKSTYSNNNNINNKNSINNSKINTKRNSDKSNKNSSINDKTFKNKSSDFDELDNFDIEIIKPNILDESIETSSGSINGLSTDKINSKLRGKRGSDRLYYVEMRNLQKRAIRINKKRTKIVEEKLSHMKPAPKINKNTIKIMAKKNKEYIPIQERAAQIHSKHLTQTILYDLQNKMEKEDEENKEIEYMKKYKNPKTYNEKDWNNFVNKQFQWKEEINFKRKAEEILKDDIYKKYNNRPYMNSKSRNIINKRIKKNASMDNVYMRLYNDYEEREERQEILNKKYMPSFRPLKRNINYKKFINKKLIHKNNSEIIITSYNKDNYFLESQISLNGDLNNNNNYKYNCSRNKCKYCYIKNENNKNNIKIKPINNSTLFVNKSTNDNTFRVSKFGTIDSILPTESCISNHNYYNYKNGLKLSLNNDNIKKGKKQNIIRLNKVIKPLLNNNYKEEEKQIYKENNFINEIYERENFCESRKNINKTISAIGNKGKKFFDFDNIEDL